MMMMISKIYLFSTDKELVQPISEDRKLKAIHITCMLSERGLLWIGTSYGFVLTLPLPRLEGIPKAKGRPTVSFHGHTGPIRFLSSISCGAGKLPSTSGTTPSTRSDDTAWNDGDENNCKQLNNRKISDDIRSSERLREFGGKNAASGEQRWNAMEYRGGLTRFNGLPKRNQWLSTPDLRVGLGGRDDDETSNDNDDVCGLYESLLRGVHDMDSELASLSEVSVLKII